MSLPSQSSTHGRTKERRREQQKPKSKPKSPGPTTKPRAPIITRENNKKISKPRLERDGEKRVQGAAADPLLQVEWISVPIGQNISARFVIRSNPAHRIEVKVQQGSYQKEYSDTGAVNTTTLPVASVGTKIVISARDLETGETLEEWGAWYSLLGRFLRLIRKFFFNS